jgi:WD40 repeat protein
VGHELDIYSVDFSKDGRFIVSGSGDKKAKIWDVEKGEVIFHYNDCKHFSAYSHWEMKKWVQKTVLPRLHLVQMEDWLLRYDCS